jgi:hypothetical protein
MFDKPGSRIYYGAMSRVGDNAFSFIAFAKESEGVLY